MARITYEGIVIVVTLINCAIGTLLTILCVRIVFIKMNYVGVDEPIVFLIYDLM